MADETKAPQSIGFHIVGHDQSELRADFDGELVGPKDNDRLATVLNSDFVQRAIRHALQSID